MQTECKVLIMASQFRTQNYVSILGELAPELSASAADSTRALELQSLPHLKHVLLMTEPAAPSAPSYFTSNIFKIWSLVNMASQFFRNIQTHFIE